MQQLEIIEHVSDEQEVRLAANESSRKVKRVFVRSDVKLSCRIKRILDLWPDFGEKSALWLV